MLSTRRAGRARRAPPRAGPWFNLSIRASGEPHLTRRKCPIYASSEGVARSEIQIPWIAHRRFELVSLGEKRCERLRRERAGWPGGETLGPSGKGRLLPAVLGVQTGDARVHVRGRETPP